MLGLASLIGMLFLGSFAEGVVGMFKSGNDDPDTTGQGVDAETDSGTSNGDLLTDGDETDSPPDSTDNPVPDPEDMVLTGSDGIDTMAGNGGNDTMSGGDGNDLMDGRDGNDDITGGSGGDAMHGGTGNDVLMGEDGDDDLQGEGDDDLLSGGTGSDALAGCDGDDSLSGGDGADSLNGGDGDDDLTGGIGGDTLVGGFGDDVLDGGADTDLLQGGYGNDTLNGHDDGAATLDYLNGGDGDDVMQLGGSDMGYGAAGADTFALDGQATGVATISDYNPAEDRIQVEYDAATHPDPTLSVETDGADPTSALILLDGMVLAHVVGGAGLAASDIDLTPMAA